VVIINQRLADLYFPDEDPIGQRLRIGYAHARDAERVREVVGVVGSTRVFGLSREPGPLYYVSNRQTPEPSMNVIIKTDQDAVAAIGVLRREVAALDDDVPLYSLRTLQQQVLDSAAPQRFRALLLGSFAGVALLLACIGIYGVMAYSVAQRTRELGIRMALGATRGDLMNMVLRRGTTLAAAGVAIGSLAAAGMGQLLSGLLFGITPTDPLTFAFVVLFLMVVASAACVLPARRATRIDPTVAMRAE
jgi:putative ABC transport system permease protein